MRNRMNNLLIGTSIVAAVGAGGVIADRALAGEDGECCKYCITPIPDGGWEVDRECRILHCTANGMKCGGDCDGGASAYCVPA